MIISPIDRAYLDLANAIVVQAANDYRNALDGFVSFSKRPPEYHIKKIEKFFRSRYFRMLTKIDGEYLIERLRNEHKEKERLRKEQLCESN